MIDAIDFEKFWSRNFFSLTDTPVSFCDNVNTFFGGTRMTTKNWKHLIQNFNSVTVDTNTSLFNKNYQ